MKTFRIKSGVCALALMALAMPTGSYADGVSQRDAVVDHMNRPVMDARGNCVRTQWIRGHNACSNPAPAPVSSSVKPNMPSARYLQREDRTVLFEFGSARLTSDAKQRLDELARKLKKSDDVIRANIVGFADPIGSRQANHRLSERRANAVKDYLASKGYVNTRVAKVRGMGESKPVSQCSMQKPRSELIQCLANDRRVEVELDFYK